MQYPGYIDLHQIDDAAGIRIIHRHSGGKGQRCHNIPVSGLAGSPGLDMNEGSFADSLAEKTHAARFDDGAERGEFTPDMSSVNHAEAYLYESAAGAVQFVFVEWLCIIHNSRWAMCRDFRMKIGIAYQQLKSK